ncbi:hypothetical protein AB0D57_29750 [Streptomyces sp. NPDC048275]|uniref:hypothetical protein n=1 Tax=Streptomyces sp. NPDC048275 TaxID=3155629 RepID=UPI0033341707
MRLILRALVGVAVNWSPVVEQLEESAWMTTTRGSLSAVSTAVVTAVMVAGSSRLGRIAAGVCVTRTPL